MNIDPDVGDPIPVDSATSLANAIEAHLELKKRNATLGDDMPLDNYGVADPFENHPLFKSEEQARLEETMETGGNGSEPAANGEPVSALPWPGEDSTEGAALDESLWGKSRDFDWGE